MARVKFRWMDEPKIHLLGRGRYAKLARFQVIMGVKCLIDQTRFQWRCCCRWQIAWAFTVGGGREWFHIRGLCDTTVKVITIECSCWYPVDRVGTTVSGRPCNNGQKDLRMFTGIGFRIYLCRRIYLVNYRKCTYNTNIFTHSSFTLNKVLMLPNIFWDTKLTYIFYT